MAFPPLPIDANVGGPISDPTEHPGHHNALAAAVNDIVEHVSTLEGGGVTSYNDLTDKPTLGALAAKGAVAVPGDITATGTASSSTYLRGDGAWATPAGSGGDISGGVLLESFDGADDNAKLGAAMTYAAAQTYKPPILLLENRVYGPFTTQREVYNGFKLLGGPSTSGQPTTTPRTPQRVNVQTDGALFVTPSSGNIFDVEVSRLSFYALNSTSDFFQTPGSSNLWTSVFRDLGFSLFRHIFGNATRQFIMTACTMDGASWNVNNGRNVAMRFGGSDNSLFTQGCLLDTPTSRSDVDNTPYHLWCDYLEKSNIGPMFITAEGKPAGIRIDGSSTSGALVFRGGIRVEGRNAGASSLGSIIHMNSGKVTFRDAWLSYGASNFAGASGLTGRAGEAGVVNVSGGEALFDGCFYARAGTDGVADTVPWIYATGAGTKVRVFNARVLDDGGTFTTTGKPHVRAVSGATLVCDDSVTDVDGAYTRPGWGMVNHGSTAGTARPTEFQHYIWYGSVQPTNMTGQDIVIRTDEAV
jgi:hypothetical protein